MMKFFRKHNKKLLAVIMSLLMIVFVGGSALQGMLTPGSNYEVAESIYGKITARDQQLATSETGLLERLGMNWQYPAGGGAVPITEMDWILLSRESIQYNHAPDMATVRSVFPAEFLDSRASLLRIKPESILTAIAQLNAIEQTALAVASASIPSEAEIQQAARYALEQVKINVAKLSAKIFYEDSLEFTEEEIQNHFNKYKNNEPGSGLQFGYYIQPAAKVQYIEIDRNAIAKQIGIPNLEKKAKAFYDKRKSIDFMFRRPPDQLNPDTEGPNPEPFLSWDESKILAMEAVRKTQASEAAEKIASWILDYHSNDWSDIERDDNGYKQTPENVADLGYYEKVIGRIPQNTNFPDAVRIWNSDFFTQEDATDVPLIGNVQYFPSNAVSQSFGQLAFRTQLIIPKVPTDQGATLNDYWATNQTCPYMLTDRSSGNVYLFRVVDAQEGHIPESVDQVRDTVIDDLKLSKAYREATYAAESLKGWEDADTLNEAFNMDRELIAKQKKAGIIGTGYLEPAPFARMLSFRAALGRAEEGVIVGAGVGRLSNEVVDQIFAMDHQEERLNIIELPKSATVLVVEFITIHNPQADEFDELRTRLVTELTNQRHRKTIVEWLDPDNIQARNGFKLTQNQ